MKNAILVKLPLMPFTVNVVYDNCTVSIPRFSDFKMNSGQSAVVSPILPCGYTVRADTPKGVCSTEVELNVDHNNLEINIGN